MSLGPRAMFRRFLRWLDPRPAWHSVRTDPAGRRRFAAALAVGAFIANLPAYGAQIAISLLTARWLRLPPLPVVTGAHLSTPPIGPLLVIAAIGLGARLRTGTWPAVADFDPRIHGMAHVFRNMIVEWCLGAAVLGVASAVVVYVVATTFLAFMRVPEDPPPS